LRRDLSVAQAPGRSWSLEELSNQGRAPPAAPRG